MIILHHLRRSRSLYTAWLLEEVGVAYEVKDYQRDPVTSRAPADLKAVHPLGKAPVIQDGDLTLTETGAITAYILEKYDNEQRFAPPRSDIEAWATYNQWLHYAEGSVFPPLLMRMLLMKSGQSHALIEPFSDAEITLHLDYITRELGAKPYILGATLSGADFGTAFTVAAASALGSLGPYPVLNQYLERCRARPAYQSALEKVVE